MTPLIDKIHSSATPPAQKNVIWYNYKNLHIWDGDNWKKLTVDAEDVDKVNKMLDAYETLPEDLDTLKEIINTPADFLNNNHELGGMVNMPFGYNIFWDGRRQISYTPSENPTKIFSNFSHNYAYVNYGDYRVDKFVNLNEINGIENKIGLSGPLCIYSEKIAEGNFDIYLVLDGSSYYPSKVSIIPAYSKNVIKLPLEFTTPYIVGNDTQEHLDELYKRLDGTRFIALFELITGSDNIYGLASFLPTRTGCYQVHVISPNKYTRIGGTGGQKLKDLITLTNVDRTIIIETSDLVPTPDWNAIEGESGYIASKYFGPQLYDAEEILWNSKKATIPNYNQDNIYIIHPIISASNDIYYNVVKIDKTTKRISLDLGISANGGNVTVTFDNENNEYIFTLTGNNILLNHKWYVQYNYKPIPLSELFIPDTIARVADYEALEARVAELEAKLNEITITVDE